MSAWRSPLLHVGIAIILMVAATLVAPHVIDWNRYRPQIETWGQHLTGRKVEVRGDVRVSLFPWPTITLHDVSMANPPGSRQPDLLQADEIEARLSLAALFGGRLEVERVRFRRPLIALERLGDGTGTWQLAPRARMHLPFSPERIAIAGIRIEAGTVMFMDARRGGEARLADVNAIISAPRLIGPWRVKATARLQDEPVEISVTTGTIRAGRPIRLAIRLAPRNGNGYLYVFDGSLRDPQPGHLKGRLQVRPVPARGKTDLAEGLSLYAFSADVTATFDKVELKNIEAAPLSALHSANTIRGEARIRLGSLIEVEAALRAGRLDADWLLGADARHLLGARSLVDAAAHVAALPPELVLRLDATASTLVFGGERLHEVRIVLEATSELLALDSFTTTLPGGARLAFSGRLLPDHPAEGQPRTSAKPQDTALPQLMGRMALETADLRRLVTWAAPSRAEAIARLWRGARGRLVLDAKVDATPERLRLFEGTWRLDETEGEVSLLVAPARLDLTMRADRLDIDRYVPLPTSEDASLSPAQALLEIVAAAMAHGDVRLDLSAEHLRLWGLPMHGVQVDMQVAPEQARIASLKVADLAGVTITASGGLAFPEDTVEGRLTARIEGPDVTPLWRLLAGAEGEPAAPVPMPPQAERRTPDAARNTSEVTLARLQALGNIDLRLALVARGVTQGARLNLDVEGHAGPMQMKAKGMFTGRLSRWHEGRIDLSARLSSPRSRPLLALLPVTATALPARDTPTGRDDLPASLSLKATGTPASGVKTDLRVELAGLETAFMGTFRYRKDAGTSARGRLALRTARLPAILGLAGLGRHPLVPATFWTETELAHGGRAWHFENIRGRIGETDLAGTLTLTAPESGAIAALEGKTARWQLTGRLSSTRLHLPALLAVVLTHSIGSGQTVFRPAALSLPAIDLDMNTEAITLLPGLELRPARLTITAGREGKTPRLSLNAQAGRKSSAEGRTADQMHLALTFTPARTGLRMRGEIKGHLNLATYLGRTDGTPLLDSRASGRIAITATGRGPTAMISNLAGNGEIDLARGRFPRLNVAGFLKAAMAAEDADALDDLLRKTLPRAALPFPGGKVKMRIEAGLLTATPLAWQTRDLALALTPAVDLAAGRLDIALKATPRIPAKDEVPPPPPFTLAFVGPPRALALVPDMAELRDWVSVTALARSMARLERLERERRRILEEESAFERQQVMFERWRAWDAERRRREAERRARLDRLLHARERQVRDQLIRLRLQLAREEAARRLEELRRRARERRRRLQAQQHRDQEPQRKREQRSQQQGERPAPRPADHTAPPAEAGNTPLPAARKKENRDSLRALQASRPSPRLPVPPPSVGMSPPPMPQARPQRARPRPDATPRQAATSHGNGEARPRRQQPATGPIRIVPLPGQDTPATHRRITNFGARH